MRLEHITLTEIHETQGDKHGVCTHMEGGKGLTQKCSSHQYFLGSKEKER